MGRGRSQKTLGLVQAAHDILEEIQPASVRAVCYQLFTRGLISGMDKNNTNRVSRILARAREKGEIPDEWIVQEGREIEGKSTWKNPAAFAKSVKRSYAVDKWQGQPKRIMVVCEKGTVRGALEPVLDEYDLKFLPMGGYASYTRVNDLTQLNLRDAKPFLLLYLGDHDPSGRGMSDLDLRLRFARYSSDAKDAVTWNRAMTQAGLDPSDEVDVNSMVESVLSSVQVEIRRIALTQVDTRRLGRNLSFPASDKEDDPRYQWFVDNFGDHCWELDAMNPNDLRERVRQAVRAELDHAAWDRYVRGEALHMQSIISTLEAWNGIPDIENLP